MANDVGILTLSAALRDNSKELTAQAKKTIQKVEENAGDIDLNIGIDKIKDTLNQVNNLVGKKLKNVDLTKYYMDFTNSLLTAKRGTKDYENAIDELYKKIYALSEMSKSRHANVFETFNPSQLDNMIAMYEKLEDKRLEYENAKKQSKIDVKENIKGKTASSLLKSYSNKYKDEYDNSSKNIPDIKNSIKLTKELNSAQEDILSRYSKFITVYELMTKEAPDLKNISSEKDAKNAVEYYQNILNIFKEIKGIEKVIEPFSANPSKYFDSKQFKINNLNAQDKGSLEYLLLQSFEKYSKVSNEKIRKSIIAVEQGINETVLKNTEKNKNKIEDHAAKIIDSTNKKIAKTSEKLNNNDNNSSLGEKIVNEKDINLIDEYIVSIDECIKKIEELDTLSLDLDNDDDIEKNQNEILKYYSRIKNLYSGDIPKDIKNKIDKINPDLLESVEFGTTDLEGMDSSLKKVIKSILEYKEVSSIPDDSIITNSEEQKINKYIVDINTAKNKAEELSKLNSLQALEINESNKDDFKDMIGYMQRYIELGGKLEDFNIGMQKRFAKASTSSQYGEEFKSLISSITDTSNEELSKINISTDLFDDSQLKTIKKEINEINDLIISVKNNISSSTEENFFKGLSDDLTNISFKFEKINEFFDTFNISSKQASRISFHAGDLDNLGNTNKSETFGDRISGLQSVGNALGSWGSGTYATTNLADLPKRSKYYAIDFSKYNMYINKTNEEAEKVNSFLTTLEKFCLSAGDFRDFDKDLKNVSIDSLYKDYSSIFGDISKDIDEFTKFINKMQSIVKESGIDKEGTFSKASKDLIYSDSIPTRLMKDMGYQGIDNTRLSKFDNVEHGSVVYDLDLENSYLKSFDIYEDLYTYNNKLLLKIEELNKEMSNSIGFENLNNDLTKISNKLENVIDKFEDLSKLNNSSNFGLKELKSKLDLNNDNNNLINEQNKLQNELDETSNKAQKIVHNYENLNDLGHEPIKLNKDSRDSVFEADMSPSIKDDLELLDKLKSAISSVISELNQKTQAIKEEETQMDLSIKNEIDRLEDLSNKLIEIKNIIKNITLDESNVFDDLNKNLNINNILDDFQTLQLILIEISNIDFNNIKNGIEKIETLSNHLNEYKELTFNKDIVSSKKDSNTSKNTFNNPLSDSLDNNATINHNSDIISSNNEIVKSELKKEQQIESSEKQMQSSFQKTSEEINKVSNQLDSIAENAQAKENLKSSSKNDKNLVLDQNQAFEEASLINSALNKTSMLLDELSNKNISGFDAIFKNAKSNIDELNNELISGHIDIDKYFNSIKKIYSNLNNVVGITDTSNLEEGKIAMLSYVESISKGDYKIKKFTENKKGIYGLTAEFINQQGNIQQLNLEFDSLNKSISKVKTVEKSATGGISKFAEGLKGKFEDVAKYALSYVSLYEIWDLFKRGVNEVREFDSAMTELRKVSSSSLAELEEFGKSSFNIAEKIGKTGVEITNSAADWSKLGYNIKEASELAENSAIYSNVGDIDIDTATEHMTSTLKAFDIEAESSISIVDKFNEVGNNFAISSEGIGSALERSGAALKAAGNDIDESIALITAANESQQDPETVGNAMKVVALRVRGAKTELESMGEETDGLAESSSKLRDELLALTGVDIMESDGKTFKSTYQQLLEISKVFNKLSDVSQANVLEKLAGKTRSSVVAGLLNNMSTAEEVLNSSRNSSGSALRENEEQLKSIEGHLDKLKNTWQELWTSGVSRDAVNMVLDFANALLKIADSLGVVGMSLAGLGAYFGAKKIFGSKKDYIKDIRDALNPDAAKNNVKDKIKDYLASASAKKVDEAATKDLTKAELEQASASKFSSAAEKEESVSNLQSATTEKIETEANKLNAKSEIEEATASAASMKADMAESAQNIGSSNLKKSTNIITKAGEATKGFWSSLSLLGKIGIITTGITLFIGALDLLTDSTKETEEAIDTIKQKYDQLNSTAESNKHSMDSFSEEYKKLSKGVSSTGENISLTSDEFERYHDICNEIAVMYPSLVSGFDSQGNAILRLKGNLEGLNDEYRKQKVEAARQYTTGSSEYAKDFKNKTEGNLWDNIWDFGEVDAGGRISYTDAIDMLDEIKNKDFTEFKDYLANNAAYETKTEGLSYLRKLGFDHKMTEKEFDELKLTIPSQIASLNSVIQESLSNIKQEGVSWLDIYFMDESSEYKNLPNNVKKAMYSIANNMDESLITSLQENGTTVGGYIEGLLSKLKNNKPAENALNSLFKIDPKSTIAEQKKILDDNINILSKELGRDKSELKLSLGFKNIDELEENFNRLIKTSGDLFDIDSSKAETAFNNLSINTQEEIDLMLDCIKSTDNLNEAIDEYNSKATNNNLSNSFKETQEATDELLGSLNKVNEVLNSQSAGESISLSDFESDELKDYTNALEYQNGVYRLNENAVKDITKAKAEEAIANSEAAKSLEQDQYIKNYEKIEKLRGELSKLSGEEKEAKQLEIDMLLSSNDIIASNCDKYDLLTASIRETIGTYNEWKQAQNAPESGDMFDDTFNMIQAVRDVNFSDNKEYMKTNTLKYKAAVEFLVPDTINSKDREAVSNYVGQLESYLLHDKDGGITGLNIQEFLDKSVSAGLMEDSTGEGDYKILGEKKMKDFAEGLNLSLPMVQAIFGELKEYSADFDFSDEAKRSVNDFAMAGVDAANKLKQINPELDLIVNVSDLNTASEKTERLDSTIKAMTEYQATLDVNSEQYQQASNVIEYCNMQKAVLEQPAIMDVDTSLLSGKMQEVIDNLQQLQEAKNNLEQLKVVGADTTEAQENVDTLLQKVQELQGSNVDIFAKLGIDDTSSVETIQQSLQNLSPEVMVDIGIPAEAIANFKDATSIDVTVNDNASGKLDEIKEKIKGVDDSSPSVTVDAMTYNAQTKLNEISNTLDNIRAKRDIHVNASTTYTEYRHTVYSSSRNNMSTGRVNGTAHSGGTAYVTGNAKLQGDWGTDIGERVLIGELGREIVVDPNSGKWRTYGDNGAEFAYIPKDAIVFNHLQSESLLNQGFVNSRATAMAKGTAFANGTAKVTGGFSWKPPKPQTNYPYTPTYTNNSAEFKSNTSAVKENTKAIEKSSQKFDWIDRSLKYFSKKTEDIANRISEFITFDRNNNYIDQQISSIKDEINANNSAYKGYLNQANSVGLSSYYKNKIIYGTLNIEEIDTTDGANKGLIEQIQNFQDYYDKAMDCSKAIVELNKNIAELAKQKYNNISSKYESELSRIDHMTSMIDKGLSIIEAQGRFTSENYYTALIEVENKNISLLKEEYDALYSSLGHALNTGEIEEYSEAWYDMTDKINSVSEALQDANLSLLEYQNQMREMDWSVFEKIQSYISNITSESDFLIDLLDNDKLYDDKGNMTNNGQAVAGLHAVNYNTYMSQADQYAKEIRKINEDIAKDPYNTTLVDKRNELLKLQMDSIKAAESEKEAMKDLISNGYNKMLESLQELINKRKEALNAEKDIHDYEKSISEKTKQVSDLQKQLLALENDDSEESQSKKQQLQDSLDKSKEDLEDTEYDKWISDQEKLLDILYSDYEEFINIRLDDIDGLLSEIISSTNDNAGIISDTIKDTAASVGYELTDSMNNIWNTSSGVGKVVSDYTLDFSSKMTTVQIAIDNCKNYLYSILEQVKKDTSANTGGIAQGNGSVKNPTTPKPSPPPAPTPPKPAPKPKPKPGSFFIHKKDYYPKNQLDINHSIVDRLKYHDFDSSFSAARSYYVSMGLGSASSYRGSASQNVAMINWMKKNGFSQGGTLGKAIKASGETGFFLGRSGEEVLSIPKLELASGMVDKLITANTLLPDLKSIKPIQLTSDIKFIVEEMSLPNVTNSQEFANEFITVLKNNNNIQNAIRSVSTDLLIGKNSLSVKKFK
ncbi:phage tail tape measure protein [Clostridium sp.]|uniref:phage tail tape measure protein n=1 Tax=Clostridium sp. TaxID=1506 RepID=UPI003217F3B4